MRSLIVIASAACLTTACGLINPGPVSGIPSECSSTEVCAQMCEVQLTRTAANHGVDRESATLLDSFCHEQASCYCAYSLADKCYWGQHIPETEFACPPDRQALLDYVNTVNSGEAH